MLAREQTDNDEDNPFLSSNIDQKKHERYNKALQKSLNKVKVVIILTMAEPLLSASIYPIIVLYIQSFSDATTAEISLLMLIGMLYYALSCLIYTSLSDKYGYDKLFILSFLLVGIALLLQAMASNIWIYVIGFFLNKIPTISVGFAYIPTILPHKYAVRYTALLWTVCSIVYLLGPIIGSIIVKYLDYRSVYYFDTICHFLCFIISYLILRYKYLDPDKIM